MTGAANGFSYLLTHCPTPYQASSRVVKDPGPLASLLYVTVFLMVPGPVRFSIIPVLIEEITASSRLAVDVLTITGKLKHKEIRVS